jgi:hypothetical protein
MNLTALKGTVQGYFDRAVVEVAQTDYETPLANSELGYQAKLAPNTGTFVQFRVIGELPLDTQANSDSPKTYTDEQEPSAAMTLSDEVFQASIEEIAGYVSLRARLIEQDPIDILPTVKKRFVKWARRMIHTLANDRMVIPMGAPVTNLSNTYIEAPLPFRSIYAGGKAAFSGMQAEDFISLPDILRAVALLRNANVPMIKDRYACVIDSAGIQQLALGDSRFGDRVEAFKDSKQRVLSAGDTIDYAGVLFKVQSDPYRCHLPGAGGELRVRKNAGKVRVCHIFGENAWGYLDLGEAGSKQRQLLAPNFKVQDITVTGNHITCALRFPVQCLVMRRDYGLNLAYVSAFDEVPGDLPDEDAE